MLASSGNQLLIELPPGSAPSRGVAGPALEAVFRPSAPSETWVAAPGPPGRAQHPWDEAHRTVRDPESVRGNGKDWTKSGSA
jgi:hypothetical protein